MTIDSMFQGITDLVNENNRLLTRVRGLLEANNRLIEERRAAVWDLKESLARNSKITMERNAAIVERDALKAVLDGVAVQEHQLQFMAE